MGKIKEIRHSKGFYIYRVVRNVILGVIIAALAAIIALIMITRVSGGTPAFFGYSMYRVSSGSMRPELEVGDVILNKELDPLTAKIGDIITYKGETGAMRDHLVTHRVVKAPYKKDGTYYLITKGDSNVSEDDPIKISQVESKYISKISVLKLLYNFFVTPVGLLVIIALIIFAFFNEIVILVKAVLGIGYDDKPKESVDDIIERYQKENLKIKSENSENDSDDNNSGG